MMNFTLKFIMTGCLYATVAQRQKLLSGLGLSVSRDGSLLVSISDDKSIKVFDIPNIDMMAMLRLTYVPSCAEWIFRVRCSHPSMQFTLPR